MAEKDIEAYARAYAGSQGYEATLVRIRRRHVLAFLARHPGGNVLEVGCALEPLFDFYDDYALHVTVEPAELFFAVAAEKAAHRARVRVLRAFVEEVDLDVRFDVVVASSMLHEVPDPESVLRAIARLCDERTVVHVNVPNARSFHRYLGMELGLLSDLHATSDLGRHLQRQTEFDRESLCAMAEKTGFSVQDFGTYALKPFTHAQMQAILDAGIVPAATPEALDALTRLLPEHGAEMFVELVRK